jgi:hypothetical protein
MILLPALPSQLNVNLDAQCAQERLHGTQRAGYLLSSRLSRSHGLPSSIRGHFRFKGARESIISRNGNCLKSVSRARNS